MAKLLVEDQAEILDAVVADGVRNFEEILKEDAFVDANEHASRRAALYSVLAGLVQRVGEVHEL